MILLKDTLLNDNSAIIPDIIIKDKDPLYHYTIIIRIMPIIGWWLKDFLLSPLL